MKLVVCYDSDVSYTILNQLDYHYDENTGMEYSLLEGGYLGACHSGVGQMTYFYLPESDWFDFIESLKTD